MGSGEWVALALAALGAAIVAGSGQGTRGGAAAGLVVAAVSIAGLGAGTLLPLAVFVLGSGALTRLGRGRKETLGAAQSKHGQRDARHVAAKLGLPAVIAMAAIAGLPRGVLSAAYAAAIAGAFADTAATEVGPLLGKAVYGFRNRRWVRLRHGEVGGMSLPGLAAAVAAASAVVAAGCWSGLLSGSQWGFGWGSGRGSARVMLVIGAAVGATIVEGAVADTAFGRRLGHFGRNGLVSALAALGGLCAGLVWSDH